MLVQENPMWNIRHCLVCLFHCLSVCPPACCCCRIWIQYILILQANNVKLTKGKCILSQLIQIQITNSTKCIRENFLTHTHIVLFILFLSSMLFIFSMRAFKLFKYIRDIQWSSQQVMNEMEQAKYIFLNKIQQSISYTKCNAYCFDEHQLCHVCKVYSILSYLLFA